VHDAIRHHTWATLRLIDACSSLSDTQLTEPVPAIYGSVIDTLRHLVDSDGWYVFRLMGGQHGHEGLDADADLDAIRTAAMANGLVWEQLLAADPDPEREIVSLNTDGETVHTYVGIRLAQAVHHGTDHRSQICTGLTTLGVEPPDLDVWAYGGSVGRLTVEPPSPDA